MTAEQRRSPWNYLGWTIFPILDDETDEVIFYDIHEPGPDGIDCEYDTLPNLEVAREAIRRYRTDHNLVRALENGTVRFVMT